MSGAEIKTQRTPDVIDQKLDKQPVAAREQSDSQKALEAANHVSDDLKAHPEREAQYRKKVADAFARLGNDMTERNQAATQGKERTVKGCNEIPGLDLQGASVEQRIVALTPKIADGLRNGTLSIDEAGIMVALQTIDNNAQDAQRDMFVATGSSARGVSRERGQDK